MQTFSLPSSYSLAFDNGRTVTLDNGALSLVDETGDAFTFGYVGNIFPEDMPNFLESVALDNEEGDWKCALEEDATAPHSALFQV